MSLQGKNVIVFVDADSKAYTEIKDSPIALHERYSWEKVLNFKNPELKELKSQNLHYAYKISTIFSLTGQLSLEKLKKNERCYYYLLNSAF